MSFLSDSEIEYLIDRGGICNVRRRSENASSDSPSQVQPCSLDIRIKEIYLPLSNPARAPVLTAAHSLGVGESVRVSTIEEFNLPPDVGAILMAPARLTRRGILVPDLGHVDPGFRGPLRVTLINMGREPDHLEAEDVVGTVLFFKLANPAVRPFNVQPGAEQNLEHGLSDVRYLSPDFLDFKKRATDCARKEARKVLGLSGWRLMLHWALPIILGVGGAYVLYMFAFESRLARAEAQFEAIQKLIGVEKRLSQLEARSSSRIVERPTALPSQVHGQQEISQKPLVSPTHGSE